ncbi:MAG TPA: hypothetical protein PLR07_07695, partial [Promineifilum sp.]|nr:hypothetical protein [Promineifilum sp.]
TGLADPAPVARLSEPAMPAAQSRPDYRILLAAAAVLLFLLAVISLGRKRPGGHSETPPAA